MSVSDQKNVERLWISMALILLTMSLLAQRADAQADAQGEWQIGRASCRERV